MMYGILLNDHKGNIEWFHDSILPGIIPDHVFDLMEVSVVEKQLQLCKICDSQGARAHVIEEGTGRKLCPVLFADAVKPPWKVEQIV